MTTIAFRPYLPADAPVLAAIFRAAIEELTGEDYSPAQQDAWAASADDEDAFGARLAKALTLIATVDGEPVGFAALVDQEVVDMLYVHPAVARQGVGSALIDALERLAGARGAKRLITDASDTALPFFEARGFVAQRRNTVPLEGEWLGNTTMEKRLAGSGQAPHASGMLQ